MLPALKPYLTGTSVIIGIGNRLRSDDGLGSIIAGNLKKRLNNNALCTVIDAGISPENYAGMIIARAPDAVIIIDAVSFGGSPGEIKILHAQEIKTVNFFTTHNTSVSLFIAYLQKDLQSNIILMAIQPNSIAFGEVLSPEAARAARTIEGWFEEILVF